MPGTMVMLHSFRRTNPWFDGDIHVLHDGLSTEHQALLADTFPRLRCGPVSPELHARLDTLLAAKPDRAPRRARFYFLDAYRFAEYDRLLIADSDLLFLDDVSALFRVDAPLAACGDRVQRGGGVRDAISFEVLTGPVPEGVTAIERPFNCGLTVAHGTGTGEAVWQALLAGLAPEQWHPVVAPHTDQIVLNRHFADSVEIVDNSYNFLLSPTIEGGASRPTRMRDARVLHFNIPAKPWQPARHIEAAIDLPAMIPALRLWHESHVDLLTHLALAEARR